MKTIIFSLTMALGLMLSPAMAQKMSGNNAGIKSISQPVKVNFSNAAVKPAQDLSTFNTTVGNIKVTTKAENITAKGLKENGEPEIFKKGVVRTKRNISTK